MKGRLRQGENKHEREKMKDRLRKGGNENEREKMKDRDSERETELE